MKLNDLMKMLVEFDPTQQAAMSEVVADVAKLTLGVETLTARNMDSLDFHDVAVWQLRAALEAAYRAGFTAATKRTP